VRVVVTGAAGFIGSQLSERLVADGVEVTGIDAFTDFYERSAKEANLATLSGADGFGLVEADLRTDALDRHLEGADAVVHLAAQPGVRDSWGQSFDVYVGHNVLATQRVLDAAVRTGVTRVVFASSSSIYGAAETLPTYEAISPLPISPYGVTKLAGESLLGAYRQLGISTAALRYFTVYGPRQRPDMAIRRFIAAALTGEPVPLFGTGAQRRDFTFVSDVVEATARVVETGVEGAFNVGGANPIALNDLVGVIERVVGRPVPLDRRAALAGDPPSTSAAIGRASQAFGYEPKVGLPEGIARAAEWLEGELSRDRGMVVAA
jgi:nucleoside-diphosphate-sugar epimerase